MSSYEAEYLTSMHRLEKTLEDLNRNVASIAAELRRLNQLNRRGIVLAGTIDLQRHKRWDGENETFEGDITLQTPAAEEPENTPGNSDQTA